VRSHPVNRRSRQCLCTWISKNKPPANTTTELADLEQRESITARALDLLETGKGRAYDKALGALSEDTRERWEELIKRKPGLDLLMFDNWESRYTVNADGLIEFLQKEVMPSYESRRKELRNRPLIREQAFGEALDADKLAEAAAGIMPELCEWEAVRGITFVHGSLDRPRGRIGAYC